jgi:hypothetical protein
MHVERFPLIFFVETFCFVFGMYIWIDFSVQLMFTVIRGPNAVSYNKHEIRYRIQNK